MKSMESRIFLVSMLCCTICVIRDNFYEFLLPFNFNSAAIQFLKQQILDQCAVMVQVISVN